MEKVSENPLLFCRNLQANGAQVFWGTLYIKARAEQQEVFRIFNAIICWTNRLVKDFISLQDSHTRSYEENLFS